MADNTQVNTGTGDVIRDIDRAGVKTQIVGLDAGGSGAESLVSLTNPLPVQPSAAYFAAGAGNTSVAQLAAGASFTGTIENTLSQPAVSLLITCDQPFKLTLNQYIDAGGTQLASSNVFSIAANAGFAQSVPLNANYFNLSLTNIGAATTTKLAINTYYGTIDPAGQSAGELSVPVVIASDQTAVPTKPDGTVWQITGNAANTNPVDLPAGRSADNALYHSLVGDSSGDLAGVPILDELVRGTFSIPVKTDLARDKEGNLIPSDCVVKTYKIDATMVAGTLIGVIDTTGYRTVVMSVNTPSSFTPINYWGNDPSSVGLANVTTVGAYAQGVWFSSGSVQQSGTMISTTMQQSFNVNGGYTIHAYPVMGRYLKIYVNAAVAAGTALTLTVILRQIMVPNPVAPIPTTGAAVLGTSTAGTFLGLPAFGGVVQSAAVSSSQAANVNYLAALTPALQVITKPFACQGADWMANLDLTTTTSTALKAAGAAGVRNYVTGAQYQNTSATPTTVNILDGATVRWQGYAPASMTTPANVTFQTPLFGTAATAMNVQLGTAVTSVLFNAQGFQSV